MPVAGDTGDIRMPKEEENEEALFVSDGLGECAVVWQGR